MDAAAVSARDAAGYAEQSAASAQQASKSAQDAANAIGGLTVDVKDGKTASAVVSDVDGHKHIDFILPGASGAKVEIDNKTITRDADGKLQTAVGGYINDALNITWDGNTDGLVSVVINERSAFYKVSDLTPTVRELTGATASLSSGGTMIVSGDDIVADSDYAVVVEDVSFVVTYKDDVLIDGFTFPEKGTYFMKFKVDSEVDFTSSLTASNAVVQIDARFIPKTAVVQELENQVRDLGFSVSRANSNAATALSGADTAKQIANTALAKATAINKEIILASSTVNSTKKFKITIDDNGQLSATEVV